MKEKILRISVVCGLLIILVAQFALATTSSLSNDMLAWGFRRSKNHEQPVLDTRKFKSIK